MHAPVIQNLLSSATQVDGEVSLVLGTNKYMVAGGTVLPTNNSDNSINLATAAYPYWSMATLNNVGNVFIGAGDFDVRCKYTSLALPVPGNDAVLAYWYCRVFDPQVGGYSQGSSIGQSARKDRNPQRAMCSFTLDNNNEYLHPVPDDCLAGGYFRWTRRGSTLISYYYSSGAWIPMLYRWGINTARWVFEARVYLNTTSQGGPWSVNLTQLHIATYSSNLQEAY